MAEKIVNCLAKVSATKDNVTPDDNSFRCPVTSVWVELKENPQGEIVCAYDECKHNDENDGTVKN